MLCWVKISQTCLLRYSNILLYTGALLLRRDTLTEQTIQSKMRISHCAIFWIVLNAGTPILNQNFAFNSAKSEPAHMFEFKDGRNSMNTLSTFNANMLLQWYRILISKNALKMKYWSSLSVWWLLVRCVGLDFYLQTPIMWGFMSSLDMCKNFWVKWSFNHSWIFNHQFCKMSGQTSKVHGNLKELDEPCICILCRPQREILMKGSIGTG